MGTERFLTYEGSCSCKNGKYIIYACSPDHPWAKSYEPWYECSITCNICDKKYKLEVRDGKVYKILKTELAKKERLHNQWYKKCKEIMEYAESKGYLRELEQKINKIPSVAAIYRALTPYIFIHVTEATFRRHFNECRNTRDWIEKNIHHFDLLGVIKFLGIKDNRLVDMIDETNDLHRISEEPVPVIKPAIFVTK